MFPDLFSDKKYKHRIFDKCMDLYYDYKQNGNRDSRDRMLKLEDVFRQHGVLDEYNRYWNAKLHSDAQCSPNE